MRILLIEDDVDLCKSLAYQIKNEGFEVDMCHDGEDGLYLIEEQSHDLILLDRMLPELDGTQVLKKMREKKIATPVIMVTALGELQDRVTGLDLGADDYIVKPFEFAELMARIRSLLRRPAKLENSRQFTGGDLLYNASEKTLTCGINNRTLTNREGELIELFLRNCGQVLPRTTILARVWGLDTDVEDGNLDNYIHFIRKHLTALNSQMTLKTVRGIGYRLENTHG